MSGKIERLPVSASQEKVTALCDYLVGCFERYLDWHAADDDGAGVLYLDAFMAVHNFHKQVVLDLESRHPELAEHGILRRMAVDTFEAGLFPRRLGFGRRRSFAKPQDDN